MLTKLQRKFAVFLAKMLLLTAKSETDFSKFSSGDTSLRDEFKPWYALDLD